jgi:hypothetical protein
MEITNYKDSSKNRLIRKSAAARILIGTISTSTFCVIYSYAHARYRNLDYTFMINWLKGSLIASSLFYTTNEGLLVITKYYGMYTNFWINYSLICYMLSKVHYRYLIRNNVMKWYNAIRYSHKCFLYMCVLNLIFELSIYLTREAYLYDGEDVFDRLSIMIKNNEELNSETLRENFLSSYHILNNSEKINRIKKYIDQHPTNSKIKSIDLYDFYKSKNI